MAGFAQKADQTRRSPTADVPVYAIGDIHGRYDLLTSLLSVIAEDQAASGFKQRPQLIFLGDYVDRGPDSAKVLEALRWIRASGRFDSRMLMGNHDQGFLRFIQGEGDARGWLRWGGTTTLASYLVRPPAPEASEAELERVRQELMHVMPASHLDLLQRLELMITVGDYVFVHAGIRPNVALANQSERDLLWIREPFMTTKAPFEKFVVHGHTWIDASPQLQSNRIGVDTGAYETGVLTAVRLYEDQVGFLRSGTPVAAG